MKPGTLVRIHSQSNTSVIDNGDIGVVVELVKSRGEIKTIPVTVLISKKEAAIRGCGLPWLPGDRENFWGIDPSRLEVIE